MVSAVNGGTLGRHVSAYLGRHVRVGMRGDL
jgi:hypothetical protein